MPSRVLSVLGPTNAGKSTFLSACREALTSRVHLVEVGKLMRAKYPPSHFAGQGSPAHTAAEAWQMACDGVAAGVAAGCDFILLDGQPRDLTQATCMLQPFAGCYPTQYLHLTAPRAIAELRAQARDSDPAAMELSRARMVNDRVSMYEVLTFLALHHRTVVTMDTTTPVYDPISTLYRALGCGAFLPG